MALCMACLTVKKSRPLARGLRGWSRGVSAWHALELAVQAVIARPQVEQRHDLLDLGPRCVEVLTDQFRLAPLVGRGLDVQQGGFRLCAEMVIEAPELSADLQTVTTIFPN